MFNFLNAIGYINVLLIIINMVRIILFYFLRKKHEQSYPNFPFLNLLTHCAYLYFYTTLPLHISLDPYHSSHDTS